MYSPTDDIKMKTAAFYDEYDGKILDVIDSESQDKYLTFLPEYVDEFPTFQESVYLAIFNSYPELNECYNDYQLTSLKEGKKEHPKVLESKNYHRTHKLKGTAYSRYYDEMVIKPSIARSGMTKESCYHFRFSQDPELSRRYVDYKLEAVLTGASPKAFVEKCRDAYRTKDRNMPFHEFYYKEFYEYDYLYRHDPELPAVYTDCTLMVLRDGKKEIEDVLKEKECAEKDYKEKSPNKPFWCYFCKKFYGDFMDKLPAREYAVKNLHAFLTTYKKTDIWKKQGHQFQSTQSAKNVRNIAFHLAFVLKLEISALQDLLQKGLLQDAINPKSPREAIYCYCLYNSIPYEEMVSQYWEYIESEDFEQKYSVNKREDGGQEPYTLYWGEKLKNVLQKEKTEFYKYLWWLRYSLENDSRMSASRKAPSEIFWDYFVSFPTMVWVGERSEANNLISSEEVYNALLVKVYEKEDWLHYTKNKQLRSFQDIDTEIKKYEEIKLTDEEYIIKYSEREKHDFLESEFVKQLRNYGDIEETAERHSSTTEYERLLLLILEKSQKNYYAEEMYKLLSPDTLKIIFGDLKYTGKTVRNRRTRNTPLSRNELISTMFISTAADAFTEDSKKCNPRKSRWENFETEVNNMLEICGMGSFYERNPFELFIRLCFLYPDPLGYFLASLKYAGIEINESN